MTGRLRDYLALPGERTIAIVGAGGKTSLAYALARELTGAGEFVAFTKTTTITTNTFRREVTLIVEPDPDRMMLAIRDAIKARQCLVGLATGYIRPDLLQGLAPADVARLIDEGLVDRVIVEADGARRRRIKAPAENEPSLPPGANVLVAVASADAIGQPLNEETAHRPEIISRIVGLEIGGVITPAHVARLLIDPAGGRKGLPAGVRFVCALTWVKDENRPAAQETMRLIQATGLADAGLLLAQGPDGYLYVEEGWTISSAT